MLRHLEWQADRLPHSWAAHAPERRSLPSHKLGLQHPRFLTTKSHPSIQLWRFRDKRCRAKAGAGRSWPHRPPETFWCRWFSCKAHESAKHLLDQESNGQAPIEDVPSTRAVDVEPLLRSPPHSPRNRGGFPGRKRCLGRHLHPRSRFDDRLPGVPLQVQRLGAWPRRRVLHS